MLYAAEGDASLHSDKALKKRRALRNHPKVVLHIKRLWSLIMRGETCSELSKRGYIELNLRLYKALMPEFDAEEAIEAAETDWMNDVGDATAMGFGGFFDSVFELVDIWVPEVDAGMYVQFCQLLEEHLFDWSDTPPRMHELANTMYIEDLFRPKNLGPPRPYDFVDPWAVRPSLAQPQIVQQPHVIEERRPIPRTGMWGKVRGRTGAELKWGDAALQRLEFEQQEEEWTKPSQWGRLKPGTEIRIFNSAGMRSVGGVWARPIKKDKRKH